MGLNDASKNYRESDYQKALHTAAFLFGPSEPPGSEQEVGTHEFRRGVVNLLADLFPRFEVETCTRMDEVQRDLAAKHEQVWTRHCELSTLANYTVIGRFDHDDGGRFAETFPCESVSEAEAAARKWAADNVENEWGECDREAIMDEVIIAGVIEGDCQVVG